MIQTIETPIGPLTVEAQGQYITSCGFGKPLPPPQQEGNSREAALIDNAAAQLREYFAGERRVFTLPLRWTGTAFQQAVWRHTWAIPYGKTLSYGQVAAALGRPRAARAVGGALHANPLALFVPCHRVVGGSGRLTGFAGGIEVKKQLLEMEKENYGFRGVTLCNGFNAGPPSTLPSKSNLEP